MSSAIAEESKTQEKKRSNASTLAVLFAIAYLSHGLATQFGLIAQPIQFFMMSGLNLNAAQISSYLAVMMLPWVLKPVFGLVCDFIPLFGYRRKSYVVLANALTAAAFGVMACAGTLEVVLGSLLLIAVGMSMSTALMVGLAAEQGRSDGKAREYFSDQALWYYSANVVAAIAGGVLCQKLAPLMALHTAAAVALIPVVCVSVLSALMIKEERSNVDLQKMRETLDSLVQAAKTPSLWLVGLFGWFWNFAPAFGVPLYFYESKTLGIPQESIGQLGAWMAGGMVLGAFAYRRLVKNLTVKSQLCLGVALVTFSTLSYLLLTSFTSAILIELFRGASAMVALLALYGLTADSCPRRAEVSIMAILLAVRNFAIESSTFVGGNLFTHVFHNQYFPLVIFASISAGLSAALIPLVSTRKEEI